MDIFVVGVVFLFGELVGDPLLIEALEWPHWLWLFLANFAGVLLHSTIVPRVSRALAWWTRPARKPTGAGSPGGGSR